MMYQKVEDLVDIRFGYYTSDIIRDGIPYIQVKQFNERGFLTSPSSDLIALNDISVPHLLQDGDILFVGKGNRLFAWCYRNMQGQHVASSVFFVLRPNQASVSSEYLTAILNSQPIRIILQKIGGGTNIFSIRKSELGALAIPVPPMARQKKIAALSASYQQEAELTHQLLTQKENLYNAVISKLIK